MPERFEEYLRQVGGQIRWKRAVPALTGELREHLVEQKEALLAEGIDDASAETETLRQMGDALEIGRELDGVHRPEPQWGLLALVCAIALFGGCLRVALGEILVQRVVFFLFLGFAALFAGYFLDYSFFGRRAKWICLGMLAVCVLSLDLLPYAVHFGRFHFTVYRNGVNYVTRQLSTLFPFAYALGVYALRAGRRNGFMGALVLAGAFAAIELMSHNAAGAAVFCFCALATLLYAIRRNWFGVSHKGAYAVLASAIAASVCAVWIRYGSAAARRISLALHPELDAHGRGVTGVMVRETIGGAATWGAGQGASGRIPEATTDFLLATFASRCGLIPALLLCAALIALVLVAFVKCLRMQNALGGLIALSVTLSVGAQLTFSMLANLGYILLVPGLPLVSGSFQAAVCMGLLGVMLSAFRQERLPEPPTAQNKPNEGKRLRWSNGELTLSLRKKVV